MPNDFMSCPACAYYAAHEGTLCPAHEFLVPQPKPQPSAWLRRVLKSILAAGKETL